MSDVMERAADDLEQIAQAIRDGTAEVDYYSEANFRDETEVIELRVNWSETDE